MVWEFTSNIILLKSVIYIIAIKTLDFFDSYNQMAIDYFVVVSKCVYHFNLTSRFSISPFENRLSLGVNKLRHDEGGN